MCGLNNLEKAKKEQKIKKFIIKDKSSLKNTSNPIFRHIVKLNRLLKGLQRFIKNDKN